MKILEEEQNPLDIFCTASNILNKAVEHTLGPNGTNTAVQNSKGQYDIINDGKSIIEHLTSTDPVIAPALETLKQSSFETNRKAGDGSSSTVIMMNALLQGARQYLQENPRVSRIKLRNILDVSKDTLIKGLNGIIRPLSERKYENVAEVALGSSKYAKELADVYKFLGRDRRPTLIKSDIPNMEIEKIEGVSLDKIQIVSSLFTNTTEYRDINVICIYEPLNRFNEITQLLRKIQQTGKMIFLFYNKMSTDILENILFNYTNGAIKVIPISLCGYGQGTYSIMQELADYCSCSIIDDNEIKISEISKIIFGNVEYATLSTEQIILKNSKKFEQNYLHLKNNSVIIRLGGTNIIEREEEYRRIEDAINSLDNAIKYGIVPGAGYTYYQLGQKLLKEYPNTPTFILEALNTIFDKLKDNVDNEETIYDSTMVIKEVISNSFSIVSQVITTNEVIHENIR